MNIHQTQHWLPKRFPESIHDQHWVYTKMSSFTHLPRLEVPQQQPQRRHGTGLHGTAQAIGQRRQGQELGGGLGQWWKWKGKNHGKLDGKSMDTWDQKLFSWTWWKPMGISMEPGKLMENQRKIDEKIRNIRNLFCGKGRKWMGNLWEEINSKVKWESQNIFKGE